MEIKVFGTGCRKCQKLFANASEAVFASGAEADVIYVSDLAEISKNNIFVTPALMFDGKVVAAGKVPKTKEIIKLLVDYSELNN